MNALGFLLSEIEHFRKAFFFLIILQSIYSQNKKNVQLKFIYECALIQSEVILVALQLKPIKVLSVIGQRTKEHS